MPRSESLRRIESAVRSGVFGVTTGQLRANFLKAVNQALRSVGAPTMKSLDDSSALRRAVLRLEASV